jgi:hypothetical protein
MDFLADEMHGLGIRNKSDTNSLRGRSFLIARRATATIIEPSAFAAERLAAAVVRIAVTEASPAAITFAGFTAV